MKTRFTYPLFFHYLSRKEERIYEDRSVTVTAFPLLHRKDAPVCGFLFQEKERERTVLKKEAEAWKVPVAFMQYLKKGADFISPEGEIVSNSRLTVSPPPARSYAYMTDTLFRERFADVVRGVDLLYHDACIACLAGVKKLLLGHFSARYPDPTCLLAEAQAIFPNTFICTDGDTFEIPALKRNT